jgi:glycosyltransferase involved in cell wall biosynthesis
MRVAIDVRSLRPPLTGIGHYVHRLINAMLPLLSSDEVLLAFNRWQLKSIDHNFLTNVDSLNSKWITGKSNQSSRSAADKAYIFFQRMDSVRRGVRALQARSFRAAEKDFDLYHAANFIPPAVYRKPVLPVIYDLSFIRFPDSHPKERVERLVKQLRFLVDVPYVQTISEFSKNEIALLLGIPRDRIYVAYPAPGANFGPDAEADDAVLEKYKLKTSKYFLVVATREPRKNFCTVGEAYIKLPAALRTQIPLLWVGPSGWGDLSLSAAVERVKQVGQIQIMNCVSDGDLAALYRNTALFLMPSIYEGFGMPVVEALTCGARVALSRIPVFEEIAGGNALYVDPMDVEGWRQVMENAVNDGLNVSAKPWPQPNLKRFSWTTSAMTTLDLYRRLFRCY